MMKRLIHAVLILGCAAGLTLPAAAAERYPDKPLRLIVPFPPGGGTDAAGRQIADRLTRELSVDIVVENRAGAGGNIGAQSVAKSAPDGYTLLVGTVGTQIVNRILFPSVDFDPTRDFVPVGWFSSVPNVLVVPADSPFRQASELIEAARTRSGGLTYGSGGTGSTTHLAVELLKEMAGLTLTHVPYKGSAPAVVDLIGGRVDFMIDNLSSAEPHIRSGRLRVLAVTTTERLSAYPEVPVIKELKGLSDYEAVGWTGVFAPRGIPEARLATLSKAMASDNDRAGIAAKVLASGAQYVGLGHQAFDDFLKRERERWIPIAQAALKSN